MTTRFTIDLAHLGSTHRSPWDWFLGPEGVRHLAIVAAAGIGLALLAGLGVALPLYLKYSNEVQTIGKLRRDVTTSGNELATLQASLRDLASEARRQVRWSELLPALSQRVPEALRVERVSLAKAGRQAQPGASSPPSGVQPGDLLLDIEASTKVAPGGSRLVDIADFINGLAQEPTVSRRFQLKSSQVRPGGREAGGGEQLQISVTFAEKRP